jgi:hypothetical protein
MKRLNLLLLFVFLFSNVIFAEQKKPLQCLIAFNKDAIWNNFDVRLDMYSMTETAPRKFIMSFELPKTSPSKEASSVIKQFDCQTYQRFIFTATFTPPIWHSAEGKPIGNVSDSKGVYDISPQVSKPPEKQNNLIITIHFPGDFNINENPNVLVQPKSGK